jgi:hypothetical protein
MDSWGSWKIADMTPSVLEFAMRDVESELEKARGRLNGSRQAEFEKRITALEELGQSLAAEKVNRDG